MGRMPAKPFYLTTPIYYVNDAPHIGHAYTTVAADVVTRWHRQRQEDVWFLTGTDEHGEKVLRTATANGVSPQEWADRLVESAWKPVLETLDVRNDDFIRTTEPRHESAVQAFLQDLHDKGEIYQGSYEGPYCVGCEEYKLPGDLVDGTGEFEGQKVCPIHLKPVEMLAEQNYFFRMSAYADRLLALYEEHPEFVQPASARNEVIGFVKQGLQDLSISRSTFDWGVPIPWDSQHVLYVWFDALLNYVTAVGYGSSDDAERAQLDRLWPANVHLVGKDILRFHAVIWPAMLMAAGLPLPHQVFAHGWLLVGGEKMSKSRLTGIAPSDIIDTFGSDAFRYYFMRTIAFGGDGSFSWEDMVARYNGELANGFGNLASRVAAMVGKYFGGVLPTAGARTGLETDLEAVAATAVADAEAAIDRLAIHDALGAVWTLVDAANLYITETQPWKVAKEPGETDASGAGVDGGRLATSLVTAVEALRSLAVLLHPVTPKAAQALWELLGADAALGALDAQPVSSAASFGVLPAGTPITKGAALFPRLDETA
ncbi:methionyl-tRNA synthetase [Xylanimonas cellulosilytica DSM 15894]|uniref:Methionine--tRNA ligase n=1 Tax=Xylanimonas cellulosilytica (strain DSM 15894 / JCM 12276 / CECT 5975 / KCTC 9989 / LMG 20990 / NBRC 107835 / XIL07) TaxID=446471 RepID=D1BXV4_XYLCX|nr:methionyl-tRNA synthetase [Xylanimonas cellulosilytica DSM 15894]